MPPKRSRVEDPRAAARAAAASSKYSGSSSSSSSDSSSNSSDSDSDSNAGTRQRARASPPAPSHLLPCAQGCATHTALLWPPRPSGWRPRAFTFTVALSADAFARLRCPRMQTFYAYELARMCIVNAIDELIVYPADCTYNSVSASTGANAARENSDAPHVRLARLMEYLETPPALRRALLPFHDDFRHVGLLPPLPAPHHALVTVGNVQVCLIFSHKEIYNFISRPLFITLSFMCILRFLCL